MDLLGLTINAKRTLRRQRLFRDRQNPFEVYDEAEILARYRFTTDGIKFLCDTLDGLESPTQRNYALPKHLKVFIGLRYLATGAFQSLLGDELSIQVSQPTISRAVTQFLNAVVAKRNLFISWPEDTTATRKFFFEKYRMPNVVGCIDGTHVQIQAPPGDEELAYVNRLNYHSINVQGVCDENYKFINVVAKHPGSTHDSTMLQVEINYCIKI